MTMDRTPIEAATDSQEDDWMVKHAIQAYANAGASALLDALISLYRSAADETAGAATPAMLAALARAREAIEQAGGVAP